MLKKNRHWRSWLNSPEVAVHRWLPLEGSLTAEVRAVSAEFSVFRVQEGWQRPYLDESGAIGVLQRQRVWTRDVLLCDGRRPLVFAHSVVAEIDLPRWPCLRGLGNRPLGEVLFQHHGVKRSHLVFRRLDARHALYHAARKASGVTAAGLWARRSVFVLHGSPLLVTEVFLPELISR